MTVTTYENVTDIRTLLAHEEGAIYLLLDGARFDDVHAFLFNTEDSPEYFPLYLGTYYESAFTVSPCLAKVQNLHSPLLAWYANEGADAMQALVVVSDMPLDDLAKHFQQYLEVKLPNLKVVLYRFYDPEVFHVLAPRIRQDSSAPIIEACRHVFWKQHNAFHKLA